MSVLRNTIYQLTCVVPVCHLKKYIQLVLFDKQGTIFNPLLVQSKKDGCTVQKCTVIYTIILSKCSHRLFNLDS